MTFDPKDDFAGVLSPDGKQLVFSSNRSGSPNLYIKAIDSPDEKLLLGGPGALFAESISSDGQTILFRRLTSGTQNDIAFDPVNIPIAPLAADAFKNSLRFIFFIKFIPSLF